MGCLRQNGRKNEASEAKIQLRRHSAPLAGEYRQPVVVLLVVVCVFAGALAIASYYYSNMRYSMEAKARATADFFRGYSQSEL